MLERRSQIAEPGESVWHSSPPKARAPEVRYFIRYDDSPSDGFGVGAIVDESKSGLGLRTESTNEFRKDDAMTVVYRGELRTGTVKFARRLAEKTVHIGIEWDSTTLANITC